MPALRLLLLLAALCPPAPGRPPQRDPPRNIAVVGAGVGGAAAAHFLRQRFGRGARLAVLERAAPGGRVATVRLEGAGYEAGGAVLHPLNLHMKRFVSDLGLSAAPAQGGLMGIYDGEGMVFEESSWYPLTLLRLLWRYGLGPLRAHLWVEGILDSFMRIYRYQMHEFAFSSTEHLLRALGGSAFTRLLNQTTEEALRNAGFSQRFINEVVGPVMRVNYGQGVNINAFVGAVSLAGAESGLWSVKGGNNLVCSGLISASKAEVIPGTVLSIEPKTRLGPRGDPVTLYQVTYNTTLGLTGDTYDIVVIAAPLGRQMANITFKNFDPPIPEFPNPYHQTVATFVHGRLNTSFFGYQDPDSFHLGAIFTMDNPKLFINSLGVVSPVGNAGNEEKLPTQLAVWKVFSKEVLTKEQLNLLFSSYDSIKVKKWLAYPRYSPPEKCPPIILHDNLYYLNGIERAASAMEMSAIAAKNAALLAYHRWYGNTHKIDQEDLHDKLKTEL
ncbi:LOW QUALITY PROTEIN: prenylcysteine oxidase 1 [Falco peregrinus]|uniref:LOW QUALITY PROTEIN: prenylcysteine oxidase 1 n=1 Tax=Falco peregrinus TaxID=8954 RepID=UPI00247B2468|nr:LOW QUALITY PROTEIN: prenylcysteine oxidase 1 [Falco peregrinus]